MTTESLLTITPENTSLLQPTKFSFIIPDMPFLKYFCQTVQLPSVTTNEIQVPNQHAPIYVHGEKLNYEPLSISAIMDEDLRVWDETYKWLKALTRPQSYDQYPRKSVRDVKTPLYFDGYLTVNTNANIPNMRIKFINCHPIAIGMVNFDTKVDADTIPTADFTFRYDYFEIQRLKD